MFAKFSSTPGTPYKPDDEDKSESETPAGKPEEEQSSTNGSEGKPPASEDSASSMELKSKLFIKVGDAAPSASNKVTIVGTGAVGMACAFSILTQVSFYSYIR